jgi:hypothetical protein
MARDAGRDWALDDSGTLDDGSPPEQRRRDLRHEDFVRLVFLNLNEESGNPPEEPGGPIAERMWLTDITRLDTGRYVGVLTNRPTAIEDLAMGDEVEFGPEHVVAVYDADAIPANLTAFAARRLVEDATLVPGYVYHDPADLDLPERDGQKASGWSLLVGDETDEDVNDPANVLTPSLAWLAARYPSFGTLVRSGVEGREFIWNAEQERYVDLGR